MIPFHRVEQLIPDLIFLVVITTTISSFALSFVNLQAAAIQAGINTWLSFLWPVCIDAVLIAGSLMILRASLRNESPVVGWLVLLGFTATSAGFNILHSPEEIMSRLAHAVPPISLCVSIEILMLIIRSDLKRSIPEPVPIKNVHHSVEVQPDPDPVREQILDLEEDTPARSSVSDEEIIQTYMNNPGATYAELGEMVGMSKSGVYGRICSLKKRGLLLDQEPSPIIMIGEKNHPGVGEVYLS